LHSMCRGINTPSVELEYWLKVLLYEICGALCRIGLLLRNFTIFCKWH